jgi:cytochrome c
MEGLEGNKIAAAILTAGITAFVCGIIANWLVHPVKLEKPAYAIAATEAPKASEAAAGGQKGPAPITPLLAQADVKAGEADVKKCAVCHTFEKGGPNKIGPNLFGIVGEPIAEGKGYQFSDALKGKHGTWDPETLNAWLFNPQAFAKGTKMTFAGIAKDKERADVIAYLQSLK